MSYLISYFARSGMPGVFLSMLILLSGDVETNPGPILGNSEDANCLSILHLNIRSIRHKLDYIKDNFLDLDVLCFTETHLTHDITDDFIKLEGFSRPFRKDNSAYSGGLLIYVSDKLISTRKPELETQVDNTIWIEIKYKESLLLLSNIYRPPNTPVVFWQDLNITLEQALAITDNIVIVGDINEDQLNVNNRHLKDIQLLNNIKNIITDPTRVTATTSTLIDPVLLSQQIQPLDSGVLVVPDTISDHRATYVFISFIHESSTTYKRKVWLYKRANFENLNEMITHENWNFINDLPTDEACKTFTEKLLELMHICIPNKEVVIRPDDKPWFDSVIRNATRRRDRQKTKAAKTKNPNDWTKYKQLRNKVNNMKKHAKEQYFNNLENVITDADKSNPKLYWKILKQLIKENKGNETIPPLKTVQNGVESYHFSDQEKANCLNDFFASISTINDSNVSLPNFVPKTYNNLSNIEISETEIIETIETLNSNKAVGEDLISHKVLKATKMSIAKPLCMLFNKSLLSGVFQSLWKSSIIMPLYKKGLKDISSNYRLISLLSCIGKLMERLIYKNIYNHLISNNLVYKKQSGFLSGHSTVHQLIDIYHQICQGIDSKVYTCMIFCDISKAFDRVWHRGLLFKLKQNGISGKLLDWVVSYLSNRQQKVFLGSSMSNVKHTSAGVPQGSVLGPLFFLIYVNDIVDNLLSITRLFADDTSLASSSSNLADLEGILNHDLQVISIWAKQWLVDFNPAKTEAMLFTLEKDINPPVLIFDDTQVKFVAQHKHLGISFSHDAKWHGHINNILTSAAKILGMMRKLKYKLHRKALNQIYLSFLRPIFEYASVVWDGCTMYEKDSLEKIQHEAARIVSGLTRSVSIAKLYSEIGWLSLADRRNYQKLILVFKSKNAMLPEFLTNLFPPVVGMTSRYELRNSDDYVIQNQRTQIFSRSFIPSSTSLWNQLPQEIRNKPTLSSFKSALLSNLFIAPKVPQYFLYGNRKLSVVHACIRNNCSNLHNDLFRNRLRENAQCECGTSIEDAEHYFFQCCRYPNERRKLFYNTHRFHPLNINTLLNGRESLSFEENSTIFRSVQEYIKDTNRF
ncbi:MAG: hypothetical protein JAY96_17510 [Candidatus Thiodiazotropha endolucinida]|nr:hypothetical protein [Candidatus Thiodiazotropha taylori]MCW4249994.1 reverse transcriptase domain-containing protein [Candidatus Thiodiazotropha endolucinida]